MKLLNFIQVVHLNFESLSDIHIQTFGETWSFALFYYYGSVCIRITFYFIIHFKKTSELFAHFYHHLHHNDRQTSEKVRR